MVATCSSSDGQGFTDVNRHGCFHRFTPAGPVLRQPHPSSLNILLSVAAEPHEKLLGLSVAVGRGAPPATTRRMSIDPKSDVWRWGKAATRLAFGATRLGEGHGLMKIRQILRVPPSQNLAAES
jgi:hypothetical protein